MKNTPKTPIISVVMSVYNGELYLAESIESVLSQTFKFFEFIIVNDGSTDNSLNIISKYSREDGRIRLISRNNKGLIYSLNEGISLARGRYIARMDADDYCFPRRLEEQLKFMRANPAIGVSGTNAITFGDSVQPQLMSLPSTHNELEVMLFFSTSFIHPTVIIDKRVISRYNIYYSSKYIGTEDYELWTRMVTVTKFANLNKVLLKYRVHSGSATQVADAFPVHRFKILSMITMSSYSKLGLEYDENNLKTHFLLSSNKRLLDPHLSAKRVNRYFLDIIRCNRISHTYDEKKLILIFGKKWLLLLISNIKKMRPLQIIQFFKSRFVIFGIISLYKKYFN